MRLARPSLGDPTSPQSKPPSQISLESEATTATPSAGPAWVLFCCALSEAETAGDIWRPGRARGPVRTAPSVAQLAAGVEAVPVVGGAGKGTRRSLCCQNVIGYSPLGGRDRNERADRKRANKRPWRASNETKKGPQHARERPPVHYPRSTRTLPNRQRQPAAQRYLGESRRWLVVSARWPREHDIRTTTGREQPTAHTHIVIDLIVDGLGVRNAGAIIFDEVLRRRDAALVPLDQALITIPQLLPAPKDPRFPPSAERSRQSEIADKHGVGCKLRVQQPLRVGHGQPPSFFFSCPAKRGRGIARQHGGRGVGVAVDLNAACPLHHASHGPPYPTALRFAGADVLLPGQR
jgi:hypothetical protein